MAQAIGLQPEATSDLGCLACRGRLPPQELGSGERSSWSHDPRAPQDWMEVPSTSVGLHQRQGCGVRLDWHQSPFCSSLHGKSSGPHSSSSPSLVLGLERRPLWILGTSFGHCLGCVLQAASGRGTGGHSQLGHKCHLDCHEIHPVGLSHQCLLPIVP